MSEKKIIRQIHLRYILNSNADKAIEAEIMLKGGYVGRASSPMAILPGKREKKISHISGKEELEKYEKQIGDFLLQNEMEQYIRPTIPALSFTEEEREVINSIYTEIQTYKDEMINKFIMGKEPLDNFDNFVETLNSMGIEEVLAVEQAAYDRYMR